MNKKPVQAAAKKAAKKAPVKKAAPKAAQAKAPAVHPFFAHLAAAIEQETDGPHGDAVGNAPAYLGLWDGKRGEHENVKIIAIRGGYDPDGNKLGVYDDKMIVCIGDKLSEWRGSTDPGQKYIENPVNSDGCAQLCEGIHYFKTGIHQGKYPAFVQAESFHVNRLNADGEVTQVQFGDFAIHLHSGGAGMDVGAFSAGCQILQCPEGYFGATWDKFYDAITDAMASAEQTLLPYMLISHDGEP